MNKSNKKYLSILCVTNLLILLDVHAYDIYHPESILEVQQAGNTRIYTFNAGKNHNIVQLNESGTKTFKSFPLIVNNSLIIMESISVMFPDRFPIRNLEPRNDQILTSLSIKTGEIDFAREIMFDGGIEFDTIIHESPSRFRISSRGIRFCSPVFFCSAKQASASAICSSRPVSSSSSSSKSDTI